MIERLPRWVEAGAFLLTMIAGSINSVALLGFNHQGASHLTGSTSLFSSELAQGQFASAGHLAVIILSFLLGACFSGGILCNATLKPGRLHGYILLLEAFMIYLAMLALKGNWILGHYLASFACGLQNAMTSNFGGALVRTTHLTGVFTDLGVMIGMRMRGGKLDLRRVTLCLTLILGFASGGFFASLMFATNGFHALLFPAALAGFASVLFMFKIRSAE